MKVLLSLFFLLLLGFASCNSNNNKNASFGGNTYSKYEKDENTKVFDNLSIALQNKLDVKELNLREKKYLKFPMEILEFANLEKLDLSMNSIDSIPNSIAKLKKLKYFSLSYCNIASIPSSIGRLENLETLDLLENEIKQIPSSLCLSKSIRKINLTANLVDSLPNCICNLKELNLLGLSYRKDENHITSEEYEKLRKCLPEVSIVYREME